MSCEQRDTPGIMKRIFSEYLVRFHTSPPVEKGFGFIIHVYYIRHLLPLFSGRNANPTSRMDALHTVSNILITNLINERETRWGVNLWKACVHLRLVSSSSISLAAERATLRHSFHTRTIHWSLTLTLQVWCGHVHQIDSDWMPPF